MGDIADMMLEGQMCQWCGEILDEGNGYPVVCAGCQHEHNVDQHGDPIDPPARRKKFKCPVCKKWYAGLDDHMKAKHAERFK